MLGSSMTSILQALILDCGVFTFLEQGPYNYYQLSGVPLSDLPLTGNVTIGTIRQPRLRSRPSLPSTKSPRRLNQITFVRSRILYAKASLNAKGEVRFGLKHIHVLNRFPDAGNLQHTVQVMKYIFPRQFGLHNVFTSDIDKRETAQPFKDYTMRDAEIAVNRRFARVSRLGKVEKLPRRLRGPVLNFVRTIQRLHSRCPYTQLLRHYCPILVAEDDHKLSLPLQIAQLSEKQKDRDRPTSICSNQTGIQRFPKTVNSTNSSIHSFATPAASVSAFCKAVFRRVLPRESLGIGAGGCQNWKNFLECVDTFVRMRRAESLSLHQAMQGLKIVCIPWLQPLYVADSQKVAKTDIQKRLEIFQEWVYYIFDSLLTPLIRSNFYVTESAVYGKRLFYFRHDIWRKLTEPTLGLLRSRMFEALAPERSRMLLKSQRLGYGQLRLVPKAQGMRPILNLKRRNMVAINGQKILAQSVNKQLRGVLNAFRFEQARQPSTLGSAMFSVGDIHNRIAQFASTLKQGGSRRLFFVKVDIKSCFDTIPQVKLLQIAESLLSRTEYQVIKHAEIKLYGARDRKLDGSTRCKYIERASTLNEGHGFLESEAAELALSRKNVIFVDTGSISRLPSTELRKILREHVQNNMVRIGRKYFRQEVGIPQGSVLSTLLCSHFYAAFERENLGFLERRPSLLLRLIDDFLLITVDENIAHEFVGVMAAGAPEYGISINPPKSLANFDVYAQGEKIPRHHGSAWFPYCGMRIHMENLQVSRNWERRDQTLSNHLTVERSREQGRTLQRRVMLFLKIRMEPVLFDTMHNTPFQVGSNVFQALFETAIKFHLYVKVLGEFQYSPAFLTRVIENVVDLTQVLVRRKSRKSAMRCECKLTRVQVKWLGIAAFEHVLRRKQTCYAAVLSSLNDLRLKQSEAIQVHHRTLDRIVSQGAFLFRDYRF